VRRPRSLGTVAAFDVEGEPGYSSPAAAGLAPFALARGILVRPLGNVVYLLPPFCTTADEIAHTFDILAAWLEDSC
jgi:adenosylmethionine-8-amino-7-oxononanoate aminotransferase